MKTIQWDMKTTRPMHPKYVALLGISTRVFHMCLEAYEEWGKDPSTTFTLPNISEEIHRTLRLYEDNFPSYCSLLRGPSLILANHLLFLDGVLKRPPSGPALQLKTLVEEMDRDDPNFQGPEVAYPGERERWY